MDPATHTHNAHIAMTKARNDITQRTTGPDAPRNLTPAISNSIGPDVDSKTQTTQNVESAAIGTPKIALAWRCTRFFKIVGSERSESTIRTAAATPPTNKPNVATQGAARRNTGTVPSVVFSDISILYTLPYVIVVRGPIPWVWFHLRPLWLGLSTSDPGNASHYDHDGGRCLRAAASPPGRRQRQSQSAFRKSSCPSKHPQVVTVTRWQHFPIRAVWHCFYGTFTKHVVTRPAPDPAALCTSRPRPSRRTPDRTRRGSAPDHSPAGTASRWRRWRSGCA